MKVGTPKRQASQSPEEKPPSKVKTAKTSEMSFTPEQLLQMRDVMASLMDERIAPLTRLVQMTKNSVEELKRENTALKTQLDGFRERCELLEKQHNKTINRLQERNLIVALKEDKEKTAEENVKEVFKILGIDTKQVLGSRIIGGRNGKRTIIAELNSKEAVMECLKNGIKLKGSDIFIRKDLSIMDRATSRAAAALKKDLITEKLATNIKFMSGGIRTEQNRIVVELCWSEQEMKDGINRLETAFPGAMLNNLKSVLRLERNPNFITMRVLPIEMKSIERQI